MADYSVANLRRPQGTADLGREVSALYHNFGVDFTRKNNLHLIESGTVLYALGNTVVFENINDGTRKYLLGLDDGGVGAIAVHPTKKMFAVGGRGHNPNIYIYSYPELQITKVLKGGAERGYSALSYNAHGTKLASVATAPDYMLTVWDWEKELIELHSKAFGQEIFGVKFSKDDDARLTTAGTGHIRFWKMASTFTGLKLQGNIGKFGKVELTDVYAMDELPDGKVVSGTENGALLLWEGNFIKCRFVKVGGKPCHVGNVTYVELDRTEKCLITAAEDGWIRWWDFTAIDTAEVDTDITMDFELLPVAEYHMGEGHTVKCMLDCGNEGLYRTFIVNDGGSGKSVVLKIPLTNGLEPFGEGEDRAMMVKMGKFTGSVSRSILAYTEAGNFDDENEDKPTHTIVSEFHSGAVTGLVTATDSHLAVSSGMDGNIRVWDYANKKLLASRRFDCAATSIAWLPTNLNHALDKAAKQVIAGFSDGTARILSVGTNGDSEHTMSIKQKVVLKPHTDVVNGLSFSADGSMLAISSTEGEIFLFRTAPVPIKPSGSTWTPLRMFHVAKGVAAKSTVYASSMSWREDGQTLLLTCTDGILRSVDLTSAYELSDDCDTYEIEFPMKDFKGQVMHKVEQKKVEVVEAIAAEGASVDGDDSVATPAPAKPETQEPEKIEFLPVKVNSAMFKTGGDIFMAGVTSSMHRMHLLEFQGVDGGLTDEGEERQAQDAINEHSLGLYAGDGKTALKTPTSTSIHYSISGNFICVGTSDGSVVVRPTEFDTTYLRISAHNGDVCFVCMSFDDKFIISAGADGVVAVHSVDQELVTQLAEPLFKDLDAGVYEGELVKKEKAQEAEAAAAAAAAAEEALTEGLDILSPRSKALPEFGKLITEEAANIEPGAYSIQDAKLKAEEDAKRLTAEEVKEKQRALVKNLQREYDQIVAANEALPAAVRLTAEQMTIDQEVFDDIKATGAAMIVEVCNDCEREAERAAKLRDKVRTSLLENLLVDQMTLASFQQGTGRDSNSTVRSLRTQGLPPALIDLISSAEDLMKDFVINEKASSNPDMDAAPLKIKAVNMQSMLDQEASVTTGGSTAKDLDEDKHAASASARREARRIRKENIKKHKTEEPRDDEDDERDLQAIDHATRTIGDYKLKVSPDYEVPADQHVDASKKKLQMALLEESMVKMRMNYNERFMALRDIKRELVYSFRRSNKRVQAIDTELGQEHLSKDMWEPALSPNEYPEDRDRVVATDLEQYSAKRAAVAGQKDAWLKVPPVAITCPDAKKSRSLTRNVATGDFECVGNAYDVTSFSDLGVALVSTDELSEMPESTEAPSRCEVNDAPLKNYLVDADADAIARTRRIESAVPALARIQRAKKQVTRTEQALQVARDERSRKLRFERDWLVANVNENVVAFRSAIDDLRADRTAVLADLKLAELKLLSLFQEYSILLGFESRDNMLLEKQRKSKKDLAQIELEVSDQQATLETKEGDKVVLAAETQQIAAEFENLLPMSNIYYDQLRKIYRKKVKRGAAADDDGDDDEEEEEEEDEEDEEEDDEEVDDVCPPGCDPGLHEKILELRDKKLDNDEAVSALQKQIDDTKRAYERLRTRLKQVAKDVKQSAVEIQSFQLQKQGSLNQIDVAIPLRMDQLYMFEMSGACTGPAVDTPETDTPATEEEGNAAAGAAPEENIDLSSLNDANKRTLVAKAGMADFCLIRADVLNGLSARIGDLKRETEEARRQYGELRKERVVLTRMRDTQQEKISTWKGKVRDLQMLKFGREIDLDDLEAGSNRSKEDEAERGLKEQEDAMAGIVWKLTKEGEHLREKLAKAMVSNTELLRTVGDLTEQRLTITRDLNAPGNNVSTESKDEGRSEREERQKVIAYVQLQAREIEALRAELIMLKRKEAPQMSQIIGQQTMSQPPGAPSMQGSQVTYEGQLPPIPGAQPGGNSMSYPNQR